MSGTFEVAAGAFAVVGVLDVVVRTGREVYSFLREIADAPTNVSNLRDSVRDTTLLAETSRECLIGLCQSKQDTIGRGTVTTLEHSLGSLNRELHSLKALNARFRGTNKNWNRVKYVLDERKIGRASGNLEHAKISLGNALILASRELAALDHRNLVHVIHRCFQQTGLKQASLARTMTMRFEDNQSSIISKLDDQHKVALKSHATHQKMLESSRQTQTRILSTQKDLSRFSQRINCNTAHLVKKTAEIQHTMKQEHQKTREILLTRFEDMLSTRLQTQRPQLQEFVPSREILFYGERRDMIMAYLLLAKAQLEVCMAQRLLQVSEHVSMHHLEWLQDEFEHLISSAAQEKAACHIRSTASSFDKWLYSEDIMRLPKSTTSPVLDRPERNAKTTELENSLRRTSNAERPSATQTTISHTSPSGTLRIYLPQAGTPADESRTSREVGLTFTCGIGDNLHAITTQFSRQTMSGSPPQIHAQLNVFTLAASEQHYDALFANGAVKDIDHALRQGLISPYHINREGRNLCLYYAARHARTDLFDFLESQGIGVSSLNHDFSIVAGLFKRSATNADRPNFEASVDRVLEKVYDSSAFLFEMTLNMLLWDYFKGRPRSLLAQHVTRLHKENMIPRSSITSCSTIDTSAWDWHAVSTVMNPLLQSGAYVNSTGSHGRNRFQRCFAVIDDSPGDPQAVENIASALMQAGVDIHHRDNDNLTPSMYARRHGHWLEWCEALRRNGLQVEDVARKDDAEWLLESTWRQTWGEKYGKV